MTNTSLIELRDTYFFLDNNFDELKAACKTDEQRKGLSDSYTAARDNFHKAVALVFEEGDQVVDQLTLEMKDLNATLSEMKSSLSKIAKIIQLVTKVVDVGTKLVGMAKPGL
jgi:transcriptional regulator with GAF, ATPase, and Fis domain